MLASRQIDRSKIVGGLDPFNVGSFKVKCSDGELHEWRAVLNPDTYRKAEHRLILAELYGPECVVCGQVPDPSTIPRYHGTEPDNLDHLDGNTRNNRVDNFAGLTHQGCNARRYQTEQRGRTASPLAPVLELQSASLENDKKEHYRPRFDRYLADWFGKRPKARVSVKALSIMAIGPCTYSDGFGKVHKPSQATIRRYIEEENSELNTLGVLHIFSDPANDTASIEYVGQLPAGIGKGDQACAFGSATIARIRPCLKAGPRSTPRKWATP